MAGLKFRHKEYSYTMIESAKLMCQYEDLVDETLIYNEQFKLWYESLSEDDLVLMFQDQRTRKAKQSLKYTGKVVGGLIGLMFGYASFSKSPTRAIAEKASYDSEVWMYLLINGITYKTLRKLL